MFGVTFNVYFFNLYISYGALCLFKSPLPSPPVLLMLLNSLPNILLLTALQVIVYDCIQALFSIFLRRQRIPKILSLQCTPGFLFRKYSVLVETLKYIYSVLGEPTTSVVPKLAARLWF